MNQEKRTEIALFRYAIIAQALVVPLKNIIV
jgi:hypothetical protein